MTTHEVPERIVEMVLSRVTVDEEGCWLYGGCLAKNGYGQTTFWDKDEKRRVHLTTHRIMWTHRNGPVPDGMHLDHVCHDPDRCESTRDAPCKHRACCNPDHLQATSERRNIRRGGGVAGVNSRKTHCKYGHEFTPENTYWRLNDQGRTCRTCMARNLREYRLRVKERNA